MIEALVILNIALQLADGYTTILCMRLGGTELNTLFPRLDTALRPYTGARWAWLAAMKLAGIAAVVACGAAAHYGWLSEAAAATCLLWFAGFFSHTVLVNYLVYQRAKERNHNG